MLTINSTMISNESIYTCMIMTKEKHKHVVYQDMLNMTLSTYQINTNKSKGSMKPNWVYGLLVCFLICLFRNGTRVAGQNAIIGHSIAVNT